MELPKILKSAQQIGLFSFSLKRQFVFVFISGATVAAIIYLLLGISWFSFFVAIIASGLAGLVIGNYITAVLDYIIDAMMQNRTGKRYRLPVLGNNKISEISVAFNDLLDRNEELQRQVQSLLVKVNETVDHLSEQISENAEVSNAQSSSVAETTATIKELATSAERIVQETSTVVGLAEETQHSAQKGADAITVMLEKMSEIQAENQRRIQEIVVLGKKAQEIEKVMDIINDIASNTKIIAFNAGIEAASAGESGKRFGTVAAEIRKLANTVSNSTNEIRDKIKEIQKTTNELVIVSEEETKKIQGGVDTAQTMVKELTDILEKADKTLGWVKQISFATQQQLTASDQVAVVLHDISEGVKRFAQSATQTKDTSEKLKDFSVELEKMIK